MVFTLQLITVGRAEMIREHPGDKLMNGSKVSYWSFVEVHTVLTKQNKLMVQL